MSESPASAPTEPATWYRRLYAWVESMSTTRYALAAMMIVSVVDASFFPIPPFAILIPMVLARPERWWKLAILGTVASLAGGILGYYLGASLGAGAESTFGFDLDRKISRFLIWDINASIGELLNRNLWFLTLLASVLPTPFKVVAIGSGMVHVPLSRFLLAAVIGRSIRFFLVSFVTVYGGRGAAKWLKFMVPPVRKSEKAIEAAAARKDGQGG
jgi:membrane protein YqaA with SNARE-associated domain